MILDQYPIDHIKDHASQFIELAEVKPLPLIERGSNVIWKYGNAHAFLARVDGARIIGSGSLLCADRLCVHGLSTGNYKENIARQLYQYESCPDGGEFRDEAVLIWGVPNFGHWIVTHLLRATLLWYRRELTALPMLVPETMPRRFLKWLDRIGLRYVICKDGIRAARLWVPSVVCYRGHYEDRIPYIWPESVHLLRRLVLKDMELPHPVRTHLYLSRAKAQWRRIVNEDEVVTMLKTKGIERVYLEELPVETQLDMVSRAKRIVVHFGGSSPITMFAPRDCEITEICLPAVSGQFGSRCWAHGPSSPT